MKPLAPRRVSDQVRISSVQNHLIPFKNGKPVWVFLQAAEGDVYLPLFTSAEKLTTAVILTGLQYDHYHVITDDTEFLDSIPRELADGTRIRMIVDLTLAENGNARYKELYRLDEDIPE